MADTSNPQRGTDLRSAQAAIMELMSSPSEEGTSEPVQEAQEEQTTEEVAADYDEPVDSGEEYEATEEAEYDGEEYGDEPQEARTYKVKVNGQYEEVTEDELIAGYSRQSDYTRKSQEVAEQRKLFEQQASEVEAERQQYAALLPQLQQQLMEATQNEPDWDALYERDPLEATKLERQWRVAKEQKQAQLQAVEAEQSRLAELQAKQYQQNMLARQAEETEKLPHLIPSWRNSDVAKKEAGEIRDFLLENGFPEQEVDNIQSAAIVAMARDAMLFRKGRTAVNKKAQAGEQPRPMKAGSRGTQPKKSDVDKARKRLRQSGNLRDAADLILKSGLT
jgi:hypothetical protein